MDYRTNRDRLKFMNAHKRSFSLLETIVAIYVILLGFGSITALAQLNLGSATRFKKELIAYNLAAEGIELVRNKRDSNFLTQKMTQGSWGNSFCTPPFGNCNDEAMQALYNIVRNPCGRIFNSINPTNFFLRGCRVDWDGSSAVSDAQDDEVDFQTCDPMSEDGKALCKNTISGQRYLMKLTSGDYRGFYGYNLSSGIQTDFDRRIFVEPSISRTDSFGNVTPDILVLSIVSWEDKFVGRRYISLESFLTPYHL